MTAVKRLPRLFAIAVVLLAIGVFAWNAIETSTARVNATTSTESVFSAGTVDLAQIGTVVDLLFDVDNLYPGREIEGCVEIEYRGSVPADVRLHARSLGGSGLERFVDVQVRLPRAESCDDVGEARGATIYDGRLGNLAIAHGSYATGFQLGEMTTADSMVLHVVATLIDDNAAQGLTTEFSMTIEARP